jgi:hypothetical protein
MRFRKLRIAYSVTCAIACALLVVLWVRSYRWVDVVDVSNWYETYSIHGEVLVLNYDPEIAYGEPWSHDQYATSRIPGGWRNTGTTLGFKITDSPAGKSILFPYWFPISVLALAGFAASCGLLDWRFGLRTLLIAITLLAVVLGLVVWATKLTGYRVNHNSGLIRAVEWAAWLR